MSKIMIFNLCFIIYQFAKIARSLVIPAGGGGKVGVVSSSSTNENQDQGAQLTDDDLEEGGLC